MRACGGGSLVSVRTITVEQRRARVVARHHLAGDAAGPEAVVEAVLALHATDPASVYLSVLARSRTTSLEEVATAIYDRRTLVRWMAMRSTLFVFNRADIPLVQAAISTPLAAMLRRQLVSRIQRNGIEPPVGAGLEAWLDDVEQQVEHATAGRGSPPGPNSATTSQHSAPASSPVPRPRHRRTSRHPCSPS